MCRAIFHRVHPAWPLLAALAAALPARAFAADIPVWQLSPYRVQVLVAVESQPEFSGSWQEDLLGQVQARIAGHIGGVWQPTVAAAPAGLDEAMLGELEQVKPQQLPSGDMDKVMLLAVNKVAGGYTAAAREYDVRTTTFGAVFRQRTAEPGKLADAAIRALWDSFAALAVIQEVDQKQVTLRVRGSGLGLRDRRLSLVGAGDALRPMVRFNEPDGSLSRIVRPAWTLLRTEEVKPEQAKAQVYSRGNVVLTGARGTRSESLALKVVAPDRPTRVLLQTKGEAPQALAGCDLAAAKPGALVAGRTDRSGLAAIAPIAAGMQLVRIARGEELLGLLPLVPGEEEQAVVSVPDHTRRLVAEGVLAGLRDELIDLVTLREVLLANGRAQIASQRFAEAGESVALLEKLTTRQQYLQVLAAEHKKLVAADPGEQATIDAMFDQTRAVAETHLGPEPIVKLAAELKSAAGGK